MINLLDYTKNPFKDLLFSENWTFIDIRSSDSYNGWILNEEKFSGHLVNSINFYYKWLDTIDLIKYFKKLSIKEIFNTKNNIVLCHNDESLLEEVYSYLKNYNFTNLYKLDMRKIRDADASYITNYKNYKQLVPPEFIKSSIDNKEPNFKIFHVGFGDENETSPKGHIKGSTYINTDEIEPPPTWKLADKATLTKFAKKYGICSTDSIVVTAWNQMASFRVATTLMYMGVKDVRVLNGGLLSWESKGFNLTFEKNIVNESSDFGTIIPKNPHIITTTPQLKELLKTKSFTLVDNRTWLEHIGEVSGYSYYKKKARIPGAVYGHAGFVGSNSLDYYRNIDNTMTSKEEIEELWKSQNIPLKNHLAFMCGSGWRASEVYFYAYVLGYKNISIYSDGWMGWSRDKENPTESGIPNSFNPLK